MQDIAARGPVSSDRRLEGKVALVTGAGSRGAGIGIGRAISVLFARSGARLLLVDRDEDAVAETHRLVQEEERSEARATTADVTAADDCERVVREAVEAFGRLDILVNSVGIVPPTAPVGDVDENDWELTMRVNVTSVV